MFKPQILRRSFSLFRRFPRSQVVASGARDGHGTIRIQRVRIKQPLHWSHFVSFGILAHLAWDIYGTDVGAIDTAQNPENEDLFFFPTGFWRPRPRTFYTTLDPEMQTFNQLASDPKRMEDVRLQCVDTVRKHPNWVQLGKIDLAKGSFLLDVKFPPGPPIDYEQPGLILTNDLTLKRDIRVYDQLKYVRYASLLMPTAVMHATYYTITGTMSMFWQQMKMRIGLGDTSIPTVQDIIRQLPAPNTPPALPTQTPTSPNMQTTAPAHPGHQATPTSPSSSFFPDFWQMTRKHQPSYGIEPPRGTLIVSGLVEVCGDRGRMTIDVTSIYDPKKGQYVKIFAKLRNVEFNKQYPKAQ